MDIFCCDRDGQLDINSQEGLLFSSTKAQEEVCLFIRSFTLASFKAKHNGCPEQVDSFLCATAKQHYTLKMLP